MIVRLIVSAQITLPIQKKPNKTEIVWRKCQKQYSLLQAQ